MICTVYSHNLAFNPVVATAKKHFSKSIVTATEEHGFQILEVENKGGLFSSSSKFKIAYRQRKEPSYQLPQHDDSPVTKNIKGLYGFVSSLPAKNQKVQELFLSKIQTLNCEFSIFQEKGETKDLKSFISKIARENDAILFVQPDTIISRGQGQHFLDSNLQLILDVQGNSEIDNLEVKINSVYFDGEQKEITPDQKTRKEKSESFLTKHGIKVNKNLPHIESEDETTLRTPKEIAQRVSVLAMINLVAFNNVSEEDAIDYLKKHNLWALVTPKEKTFLAKPTTELKAIETWKCEGIWTLMWALKKVEDLGSPNELCNLDNIPPDVFPVGATKDPNDFINAATEIRSKSEILDANDLYYRIDWACVDSRLGQNRLTAANPSVVFERHYALNWLVNYAQQDWDDVTCDT